ncbi:NADH dehydrogenase (ubiquinone) 1 alpha subcomplex assembly factor 3 [uncultured Gammaproteobacteria bacterium]
MTPTPTPSAGRVVIDRYGPGQFVIAGTLYQQAMLVFPDHAQAWQPSAEDGLLTFADFAPVLAATPKVELLIIGTGPTMAVLPAEVRRGLRAAGVAVECVDTRAACRTYNVLLAEERRVAAALLPL